MTDRRSLLRTVAATAALGGFAGCTTQDDDPGDATDEPATDEPANDESTPTDEPPDDATVRVGTHDEYGDVLVDGEGMSLYLFTPDEGGESTCYDGCAQSWPPLTVEGDPTAGDGVTADLATTERDDGAAQVTAADWPLYYFASDGEAGDAAGQGVNDVWFLLGPDGSMIGGSDDGGDGGDDGGGDGEDDDGNGDDDGPGY